MSKSIEYGSKAYWRAVLARASTRCDTAGRDLLVTGEGVAGPIYCTREYAQHRLSRG